MFTFSTLSPQGTITLHDVSSWNLSGQGRLRRGSHFWRRSSVQDRGWWRTDKDKTCSPEGPWNSKKSHTRQMLPCETLSYVVFGEPRITRTNLSQVWKLWCAFGNLKWDARWFFFFLINQTWAFAWLCIIPTQGVEKQESLLSSVWVDNQGQYLWSACSAPRTLLSSLRAVLWSYFKDFVRYCYYPLVLKMRARDTESYRGSW